MDIKIEIDGVTHKMVPDNEEKNNCTYCSLLEYCSNSLGLMCGTLKNIDSHFEKI